MHRNHKWTSFFDFFYPALVDPLIKFHLSVCIEKSESNFIVSHHVRQIDPGINALKNPLFYGSFRSPDKNDKNKK